MENVVWTVTVSKVMDEKASELVKSGQYRNKIEVAVAGMRLLLYGENRG